MTDNKKHTTLAPSKTHFPNLEVKLKYLYEQLGVTQQFVAERLNVTSSAISQWRDNGVPKTQINRLCICLHTGRAELELSDIDEFYRAVQKRFSQNVGTYWRSYAQQCSLTGLEMQVVQKAVSVSEPKFKSIFRQPQSVVGIKRLPCTHVNDMIQFKLPLERSKLAGYELLETLLLIVEDPSGIQLLTTEPEQPGKLINQDYYVLPSPNSPPFYIGLPTGKYCAYLVLLAKNPPQTLWRLFAEKPDGYAADQLIKWLKQEKIPHKINSLEFNVNI